MFIFSSGAFNRESCKGIYRKTEVLVGDGVSRLEKYKSHCDVTADRLEMLAFISCESDFCYMYAVK